VVLLAARLRWLPSQTDAEDPDVLEELLAYLNAQDEHDKAKQDAQQRKDRRAEQIARHRGRHE
jgi:hypothetical protein